jgi:hypothetical protein
MRITIVRYGRLKDLGNDENEYVVLEAAVGSDESAEVVYDELRLQVERMLFPPALPVGPLSDDEVPF